MRDDASNRPRLPSDAGHPQTRGFRTPTLSSHEASLASQHHLHLPVRNLPASNKKPLLGALSFALPVKHNLDKPIETHHCNGLLRLRRGG